ncbi:MAG: hypothetical protein ACI935_004112, partial [Moritella dasanensis]
YVLHVGFCHKKNNKVIYRYPHFLFLSFDNLTLQVESLMPNLDYG